MLNLPIENFQRKDMSFAHVSPDHSNRMYAVIH